MVSASRYGSGNRSSFLFEFARRQNSLAGIPASQLWHTCLDSSTADDVVAQTAGALPVTGEGKRQGRELRAFREAVGDAVDQLDQGWQRREPPGAKANFAKGEANR